MVGWNSFVEHLLEADAKIAKDTNTLLSQSVVEFERQCWANGQYSRAESLRFVGSPRSIYGSSLEEN